MILQPISVQQKEALTGGNVQTMVKDLKDSSQGNQYKHKVPRPKSCSEAIKSMHTTSLTVPRPYSAGNMGRCTDNHALNTHLSPLNNHLNNRDEGAPLLEVSWWPWVALMTIYIYLHYRREIWCKVLFQFQLLFSLNAVQSCDQSHSITWQTIRSTTGWVLNHCKCIIDYLDNYQSEGGEDLNVQMGVGVHMPFCSWFRLSSSSFFASSDRNVFHLMQFLMRSFGSLQVANFPWM